jgi:phosphoglycolate phosphatase
MKIRAIASDIDRTLTSHSLLVNLNAVAMIRFLYQAGFPVILVSARDYFAAGWLSVAFGGCGLVAGENGAVVWNAHENEAPEVLGEPQHVRQALQVLKDCLGDVVKVYPGPSRLCGAILQGTFPIEDGNAVLREQGVPAHLLDSGLAYHLSSANTGKGRGMLAAAARLGISAGEIAAIGDNFNDMEMFDAAGFSIAVGNAPPAVKEQVDYACQACYGEGFVEGVLHLEDRLVLPPGVKLPRADRKQE